MFAAEKLGIFATGARYGDFRALFQKAYDDWLPQYVQFKQRVSMPKGAYAALSQHEYAVLLKWFDSNLAGMDAAIIDPPAPTTCGYDRERKFHECSYKRYEIRRMGSGQQGTGMFMFGCEDQGNPATCFTNGYNDFTSQWGADNKGSLKEVMELGFRSSFWTRSSADGRFVGNGGGTSGGATITDLARKNEEGLPVDIKVKSSYDPGFFPDNSGFIFQGGGFGTGICSQSMLETITEVDYEDPACIKGTGINLYQHVARGLNGGDYFIINSQFTSDAGGTTTNTDPKANFNAQSGMKFSPMIFNGEYYEQLTASRVDLHSRAFCAVSIRRLVISRLAGGENGGMLGYVVRKVETSKFEDNYNIKIDEVMGVYCMSGAKANICLMSDIVTHHYEEDGTANILLVDMMTSEVHQVTNMPSGYKALFPHFRSDGWFYFLVKMREGICHCK